jgi:hypothetical protein
MIEMQGGLRGVLAGNKDDLDAGGYTTLKNDVNSMQFNNNATDETAHDRHGEFEPGYQMDESMKHRSSSSAADDKMVDVDLLEEHNHNSAHSDFSPFAFPAAHKSNIDRARFYVCWPLLTILYFTVPDCMSEGKKKRFAGTFAMSLVWLSLFSYVMLWMITVIGEFFCLLIVGFDLIF